jgi:hypothetical protein
VCITESSGHFFVVHEDRQIAVGNWQQDGKLTMSILSQLDFQLLRELVRTIDAKFYQEKR